MVARRYLSPSDIDSLFWWEFQEMVEGIVNILEQDEKQAKKEQGEINLKNPRLEVPKMPDISKSLPRMPDITKFPSIGGL